MILCSQQFQYIIGKDDEDFDEWADQLEALCEIIHRNIHHEMMGEDQVLLLKRLSEVLIQI